NARQRPRLRTRTKRLGGEFGLVVGYSPVLAIRSRNIGSPPARGGALLHLPPNWWVNPKKRGGGRIPPPSGEELLAHSTISITLDINGYLFPSKVIVTTWRQPPSVYWAGGPTLMRHGGVFFNQNNTRTWTANPWRGLHSSRMASYLCEPEG